MGDRSWRNVILGLVVLGAAPLAAAEDHARNPVPESPYSQSSSPPRLHESSLHLLPMANSSRPDWLRKVSRRDLHSKRLGDDDGIQLVLQRMRRDGADLLTVRHPVATAGQLRAYAGVGLNRSVYFAASDTGPTFFDRRNRHRSLGAAAELGVEVQLSERAHLNADVRWIEIDGDAIALRVKDGLVGADPVTFGVSLGWRFR